MNRKLIKIAPSILSADFCKLGAQVEEIAQAGADYIHVDVMDGHFVPNISVGLPIVAALNKCSKLPLDVHLMISNPSEYVEQFAAAGASIITVHIEADPHMNRLIQAIRKCKVKVGIALNPSTPLSTLEEVISGIDQILIMSVNPGFGGQTFIPSMTDKIRRTRRMIDDKGLNIDLEVDGGINSDNAADIALAGADIIVAGNSIFTETTATKGLANLRRAIG